MANPDVKSMDEADLRALLAVLERERDGLAQEERAVRERINAARAALADKLPDHGGVLGRLPGKTVKTAKLIPYDLLEEWPQSLQIEFDDGSMLIARCEYRVETHDAVTGDNRVARKV
jgi:hypothetical protein